MLKETSCRWCYVNGNKCRVMGYEDGLAVLGCFGTWWQENPAAFGAEFRAMWENDEVPSMRGVQGAIKLPSADMAGIQAVIPGAVVDWEGSKNYEARRSAAEGSRGGKKSDTEKPADEMTTPTVAPADAFQTPGLDACPVLAEMIGKMAPVVEVVNDWAAEYSAAMMAGGDAPADPAPLGVLAPMLPGLADAFNAYKTTIETAAKEHQAKQAAAAAARAAAEEAAKKAAAAAANGKTLVKLWNGETVEVSGKVHREFTRVMASVKIGRHVYMYGPAGTGKSYCAAQVAESLGYDPKNGIECVSKIDDIYSMLQGFAGANGELVDTPFLRAFTQGKFYFSDEIDTSDAAALNWLLPVLESGFATFPVIGRVKAHPNFRFMAAGNTCGLGATNDYQENCTMSPALRRRMAFVPVGYDPEIDAVNAAGHDDILEFVQDVRRACEKCGVTALTASPAEIKWIVKACEFGTPDAINLQDNLTKGLETDTDTMNNILAAMTVGGRWYDALKSLIA